MTSYLKLKYQKYSHFLIKFTQNGKKWVKNIYRMDFEGCDIYEFEKKAYQMKDEIKSIHLVYIFYNFVYATPLKINAENHYSPFCTIFKSI